MNTDIQIKTVEIKSADLISGSLFYSHRQWARRICLQVRLTPVRSGPGGRKVMIGRLSGIAGMCSYTNVWVNLC